MNVAGIAFAAHALIGWIQVEDIARRRLLDNALIIAFCQADMTVQQVGRAEEVLTHRRGFRALPAIVWTLVEFALRVIAYCRFHASGEKTLVHRQEQKVPLAAALRAVFNAINVYEAETVLQKLAAECRKNNPKVASWLEENVPEGLAVFSCPEAHRRLLRTTNGLERVNQELRRRTRVCQHFPNEASCLRLVSAILMEISDEWESGKAYLTFND